LTTCLLDVFVYLHAGLSELWGRRPWPPDILADLTSVNPNSTRTGGRLCPSHYYYRHSSIYAVDVGTQKNSGSKNFVNRDYLVVLKGRK
jgi:hypothetical protein